MALSIEVRDVEGATTGSVTLDESLFGIQPNVPVLHQVVTAQLAAARSGTQSTKTRAEVAGGGRKPFKQKGTGRARQGSERAPQFTGGGIALGPKPRSYRQRTPRKMIQLALRSALSDRAADGKVVVIGSWPWETPSTKAAHHALDALGLEGRVLIVLARTDEEAYKSFRNLPGVQLMLVDELNAYDILCNDWIVFTTETLPGDSDIETVSVAAPPTPAVPAEVTTVDEDDEESEEDVAGEPVADASDAVGATASVAEEPAPEESETGGPGTVDAEDAEDEETGR
jgi:large subunit ribosomal protein L4